MPEGFISRRDYLWLFAQEPLFRNFLDGGTLFARTAFMRANVFGSNDGSKWQAGYEFKIGPAIMGDVFYIDEGCVIAGVDGGNASFRGTQRQHYLDCIKGVDIAFVNAWPAIDACTRSALTPIKRAFIRNITSGFLRNRLAWNIGGFDTNPIDHTHMFADNVTPQIVRDVYRVHGVRPSLWQRKALLISNVGSAARSGLLLRALTKRTLNQPEYTWQSAIRDPRQAIRSYAQLNGHRIKRLAYLTLRALGLRETVRRMTGR